jgi:WD40 repeat protein
MSCFFAVNRPNTARTDMPTRTDAGMARWRRIVLGALLLLGFAALVPRSSCGADKWIQSDIAFPEGTVHSVAVSPDGKLVAAGHLHISRKKPATITVLQVDSGKQIANLSGHEASVTAVAFMQNGDRVISGDQQGFMSLWDVRSGKRLASIREHHHRIPKLIVFADGKQVVSATFDGVVNFWKDLDAPYASVKTKEGIEDFALSQDSKKVIVASDSSASVWDIDTNKRLSSLDGDFLSVALDSKNEYVALGTRDQKFISVEFPDLTKAKEFKNTDHASLRRLAYVADQHNYVFAAGREVGVYDRDTGRVVTLFIESDLVNGKCRGLHTIAA